MSELLTIGSSYRTAPVEIRERLALPDTIAVEFLRDLRGGAAVQEAVALSTCNRTELYLVVSDPVEAESRVLSMLARLAGIRLTELTGAIYSHRNCDAARHLYRVTSGLESMIIGEAEIQGQVKRAYDAALARETVGPLTNHLFKAALATGKRVRTETAIGERQLSLASVGITLAREVLGDLSGKEAIIVGTGEMSELTARALHDSGARIVFVATRRQDRAISLAQCFRGEAASFDELPEALGRADVVVAATASPNLLIEAVDLGDIMQRRDGRPLLIIDLAVPRDIDPECGDLPGVSLYDIDDLEAVIARNRKVRQAEARKAEGIIEEEIQGFAGWLGALEIRPTLAALRTKGQDIATQLVEENNGKWESASQRDLQRIDALAHAVVNRLLHHPTARMKELNDERVHQRMALVRDLFDLSPDDVAETVAGGLVAPQPREPLPAPETSELPGERNPALAEVRTIGKRRN